jgi:hypothetical protein
LRQSQRENNYQAALIRRLYKRFPGCVVLKNDSALVQGIPDLTILWRQTWAMLEVKSHEDAEHQPNQDFYVEAMDKMSFAAFIYPENEEAVLNELDQEFETRWCARLS